jgi:hypothetical protein
MATRIRFRCRLALSVLLFAAWPAPAAAQSTLTVQDVISLVRSGVREPEILAVIDANRTVFAPSIQDLLDLRAAGTPPTVIRVIVESRVLWGPRKRPAADAPPSPSPADPPPHAATERTDEVLVPLRGDEYLEYAHSGLDRRGWARYQDGRRSYGHMAWCWAVPGGCMFAATDEKHPEILGRGLAYAAATGVGTTLILTGFGQAFRAGFMDFDGSNHQEVVAGEAMMGVGIGLCAASLVANIVDGALSIGKRNDDLRLDLLADYPRDPASIAATGDGTE